VPALEDSLNDEWNQRQAERGKPVRNVDPARQSRPKSPLRVSQPAEAFQVNAADEAGAE
jgi:hypothetical protein